MPTYLQPVSWFAPVVEDTLVHHSIELEAEVGQAECQGGQLRTTTRTGGHEDALCTPATQLGGHRSPFRHAQCEPQAGSAV